MPLSDDQYRNLLGALDSARQSGDAQRAGEIENLLRQAGPPGQKTVPNMPQWQSALHGAGQGATLGFSDELYGAARALVGEGDFTDDYEKYRNEYRAELG